MSFTGYGSSCLSCLTDQNFVFLLCSVQLCKDLTEKTDHGSEIRGKLRIISVLLCLHILLPADVLKLHVCTHINHRKSGSLNLSTM